MTERASVAAPTVGRIVHYKRPGRVLPRAAIVTYYSAEFSDVDLHVFEILGEDFKAEGVPYSEEPKDGHWSWPPRV